ncbi:putative DNA-binding domain-containing protein [Methylomonas sp. AM2-LC]|uniref:HvfC family RiPP maturation protein n=1 Tax=Methylomonas sp. AM2-LC TaxID=3153301 RepID=UPI0032655530
MAEFKREQQQFLAHLRNPNCAALPAGYDAERSNIYRELLNNRFNDSLQRCFPVTHSLLGESAWQHLLKAFIAEHRCQSPLYRQLPDEFIGFLQTKPIQPYLFELAHFEWVELVLAIAEADTVNIETETAALDWQVASPIFAPVFVILHYDYPVHCIDANYQFTHPSTEPIHILGFRDRDENVQFIECQQATCRLLEILHKSGGTLVSAIAQIAQELEQSDPAVLLSYGIDTLNNLIQQGAILGATIK